MSVHKTNAARILDKAGIDYELREYEVDDSDLSAEHVAEQLRMPADHLFKTILLRGDRNGIFVAIVPGSREVNLKLAAAVSGNKKAETVAVKELLPLTGYIRGGCSPVGMKKHYPTFIDDHALTLQHLFVSAGQRGLQFKITPGNLIKATNGQVCRLTDTA